MKLKFPFLPSLLLHLHPVHCMRLRNALTTTAPAAVLQQNPACALVSATLFACESISPGFTSLLPSAQAPCLCYSLSTWIPTVFDKAVQTCASFASTAVPGAYPAFVNLEGFCGNVGNVRTSRPATTSASTTPASTTSSEITSASLTSKVSTSADQACYKAVSLIQLCLGLIPGFMALGPTQQASCLCYASVTSWVPKSFDDAVNTCSQYAQSASAVTGLLSSMNQFDGICESVGDVLTTGRTISATALPNPIISPDLRSTPLQLTTTNVPSPASLPNAASSIISTTFAHSPTQTRSIVKTASLITMSKSVITTASTAGLGGAGDTNRGEDEDLREISDPMVILISFVCAALVLFLC